MAAVDGYPEILAKRSEYCRGPEMLQRSLRCVTSALFNPQRSRPVNQVSTRECNMRQIREVDTMEHISS